MGAGPVAALTLGACEGPDPATTIVARAAGHELTAEEVARLLAAAAPVESQERAALVLANLWIDYTLLASAVAEDTTLRQLPLDPLVAVYLEQTSIDALRDSVLRAARPASEAEAAARYAGEAVDSELRARQIRIDVAPGAAPASRARALEVIRELRSRIVEGGESFEELARANSDDPVSAPRGGDLGYFGPGDMVPAFHDAARELEVGQVSEPVETEYGFHLIRLEERRTPTPEAFADRVHRQRGPVILQSFVDSLLDEVGLEVRQGAALAVGQVVQAPGPGLAGEEADTLATFRGGSVTLADVREHLQRQPGEVLAGLSAAPVSRLVDDALLPLVRLRVLAAEARSRGLAPGPEAASAESATIRGYLRQTARDLGLVGEPPLSGEAIDVAVRDALSRIVRDGSDVPSLGPGSRSLRMHYPNEVRPGWVGFVVDRTEELRGLSESPA